ncbi:hypothetical protein [Engelhardtia mirabilis]|uniref:hypothetical protein n=1 Tax=Engelhardtia mirabilis TaxID=2528011 RepID=UPI0011A25213
MHSEAGFHASHYTGFVAESRPFPTLALAQRWCEWAEDEVERGLEIAAPALRAIVQAVVAEGEHRQAPLRARVDRIVEDIRLPGLYPLGHPLHYHGSRLGLQPGPEEGAHHGGLPKVQIADEDLAKLWEATQ